MAARALLDVKWELRVIEASIPTVLQRWHWGVLES